MPTQPDRRRLTTMCDQQPTPQTQTQHRLSAPAQPTASLNQPGYTDLSSPPERPLRAPVYPLSSRPLLDQQDSVQKGASNHNTPQQTSPQPFPHRTSAGQAAPGANSPRPATPKRSSQPPLGMLACTRYIFTSHRISPPRPSISYPIVPPVDFPVDQFENPRPAPLPPTLARPDLSPATLSPPTLSPRTPSPPPPYSPRDQTLTNSLTEARTPAYRRPLSVPPPLREFSSPFATDFPDARHWCSRGHSLQLGRFALCSACHQVRHCITGLGAGRVVCNECFREHFLDGKE